MGDREAALGVMQITEEQVALERFQRGEEVEALAELDRLRATQARRWHSR